MTSVRFLYKLVPIQEYMSDSLTMTNPNIRRFYDRSYIGKIVLDSTYENVLTNIRVTEEQREKGYSRKILYKWLDWCVSEGYEEAYVVNIKSKRIESVLNRFKKYNTQVVSIRKAPGNIESGHSIPDLTYKIDLKS